MLLYSQCFIDVEPRNLNEFYWHKCCASKFTFVILIVGIHNFPSLMNKGALSLFIFLSRDLLQTQNAFIFNVKGYFEKSELFI